MEIRAEEVSRVLKGGEQIQHYNKKIEVSETRNRSDGRRRGRAGLWTRQRDGG